MMIRALPCFRSASVSVHNGPWTARRIMPSLPMANLHLNSVNCSYGSCHALSFLSPSSLVTKIQRYFGDATQKRMVWEEAQILKDKTLHDVVKKVNPCQPQLSAKTEEDMKRSLNSQARTNVPFEGLTVEDIVLSWPQYARIRGIYLIESHYRKFENGQHFNVTNLNRARSMEEVLHEWRFSKIDAECASADFCMNDNSLQLLNNVMEYANSKREEALQKVIEVCGKESAKNRILFPFKSSYELAVAPSLKFVMENVKDVIDHVILYKALTHVHEGQIQFIDEPPPQSSHDALVKEKSVELLFEVVSFVYCKNPNEDHLENIRKWRRQGASKDLPLYPKGYECLMGMSPLRFVLTEVSDVTDRRQLYRALTSFDAK